MKRILIVVGFAAFALSCNKPSSVIRTPAEQLEYDLGIIDEYLKNNSITPTIVDPSGVRIVVSQEGTGAKPTKDNCIRVSYVGHVLYEKTAFDSSANYKSPLKGWVSQGASTIYGWQIGFKNINQGSKATFYIPSTLAYGASGSSKIPRNSILKFDVELLQIYGYNSDGDFCLDK